MPTVVLADPDADRLASQRFALRAGGCDVVVSPTLQEALAAVADRRPDVLVLAEELCGQVTPTRVAAALRAQPETAGVRLVLVAERTGAGSTDGADVVVRRPATTLDLVGAVV